jgi:hypothetical protein
MSTKVKEALFELIKYLSKSEKRYFKIISSRHTIGEENNYIILFDYLDRQEEYDENALFDHFKGEAFLNKFSVTKKRLYDHILNALDSFHASSSVDAQIYRLLHGADILYHKSLYEQSRRQLRSAEKLAFKFDKYNLLSEISYKQKRLMESRGFSDKEELETMLKNDLLFHERSLTYDKFWNLKSQLFSLLSSKGVSRTQQDLVQFKAIIDDLLKTTRRKELYFDTQYLYNHIYSAYYFATGSFQDCYQFISDNLALLESKKEMIEEQPNRYFSVLTNGIYVAARLKKQQEAQLLLKKLKQLSKDYSLNSNEDLTIKLFSSINSIELTMLTLRGELKEAQKLVPVIENGLLLYANKITESRKAFLHFKIATIYFADGDMHTALKWINRILNDSSLDQQEDILSFAQILSLLIHFEMKNENLLPYALRSTQRFLKSRNRLYDFETVFLKLINKMSKTSDIFKQEGLWQELYEEIIQFKDDTLQGVAFEYFDFGAWAEAKMKKTSFQEIIRLKFSLRK